MGRKKCKAKKFFLTVNLPLKINAKEMAKKVLLFWKLSLFGCAALLSGSKEGKGTKITAQKSTREREFALSLSLVVNGAGGGSASRKSQQSYTAKGYINAGNECLNIIIDNH